MSALPQKQPVAGRSFHAQPIKACPQSSATLHGVVLRILVGAREGGYNVTSAPMISWCIPGFILDVLGGRCPVGSGQVVGSRRATTSLPPTTSHSSSLRQLGCGCAPMSPTPELHQLRRSGDLSAGGRVLERRSHPLHDLGPVSGRGLPEQ